MSRERVDLLLRQRQYSWAEEYWFASLAQALKGVGSAEAAWQPPGAGNTIWQTVNHVNYDNERIVRMIKREPREKPLTNDDTFGEAGDPADAAGWEATVERTQQIAEALREAIDKLSDADLDQPMPNETMLGRELPLWVMHDVYHTGQIVLLRKQQGSWPAKRGQA